MQSQSKKSNKNQKIAPQNDLSRVLTDMIKHVALITFCWSISPCISWHAFLGKIACPEIFGTAITTRLKLPSLPVTNCSIAATSLNQAVLVFDYTSHRNMIQNSDYSFQACQGRIPDRCDISCIKSWNSALRDLFGICMI